MYTLNIFCFQGLGFVLKTVHGDTWIKPNVTRLNKSQNSGSHRSHGPRMVVMQLFASPAKVAGRGHGHRREILVGMFQGRES